MAPRKTKTAARRRTTPATQPTTEPSPEASKKEIDVESGWLSPETLPETLPEARTISAFEGQRATTIIYVHGIGNKPVASVLKGQWDQSLFGFDLGERSRMVYWVDRDRYPVPLPDLATAGDYSDGSENAPQGEVTPRAMRATWDVSGEIARMDADVEELVGPPNEATVAPVDAARLRPLADKMLGDTLLTNDASYEQMASELKGPAGSQIDRIRAQRSGVSAVQAGVFGFVPRPMRQWLTRNVTRTFLRDVNDLFVDRMTGNGMRESLRERLRAGGGPFIMLAHSVGTMIAYTVLMEPEFANLDIPLFVTLGSPLGLAEVQDFIKGVTGRRKLLVPPTVRRWVNVCDPFDPVGLDKRLSADYGPNRRGVRIEDHVNFNADSPRHPHSATGYLALAVVRQPVRACVDTGLFQPVARFKITKDVVRMYADSAPDERHRVLVQLEDYATTASTRSAALERIYELLDARDAYSVMRQVLAPEELDRYVALSLTRQEAERLSSRALHDRKYPIARIWKNSAKWAYLDRSIHTMQASFAHTSYQASGAGVTWAVLDSGVLWAHPHFQHAGASAIAHVYDCTDARQRRSGGPLRQLDPTNRSDAAAAADWFGHGAHVAGIIVGRHTMRDAEGTERTMCGMAPDARLAIYKVLDDNGSGEDSWIIKALDHIFETNKRERKLVIHGVNVSLGGAFDVEAFNCGHTPLCMELRRLWRQGVVVVVATGNQASASFITLNGDGANAGMGMSLGDPANLEDAITVGSVHKDSPDIFGTSFFSSRGPTADGRMKPDCVAPGERIFSCRHDARTSGSAGTFEDLYAEMSGTSMAAAHVSGLVASFLSKRREFIGRPDDVKRILLANCTDLGRPRNMQGAGLPNLVKMLVKG